MLLAVVIAVTAAALPTPSGPVAIAAGHCASTTRPSYTVTVCITVPAEGATVSGNSAVTGTASVSGTNPGIRRLVFYLRGAYLLTDFTTPYTFTLATAEFVDGSADLEVEALMADGIVSNRAGIAVTLSNGTVSPPVNTNTFTPAPSTWSGSGPIVVAAVGDGAGGEPNAQAVTDLISTWNPNLFLYLGDVYEKGTSTEFDNWYGGPTTYYGRFRSITNPTIGNHEYEGSVAPGYFDYWDNVPHYFSYTVGPWHFISLDSTGQFNQTDVGSPQYQWLVNDLAASTAACTLVYFHHPVYSVGPQGDATRMNTIWSLLAQRGVDIVLTGHDHSYQRWQPLDGAGDPSPTGITQFVSGAGGHGVQAFVRSDPRLAAGFGSAPTAYGALRLSLADGIAGYQYVNTAGSVLDEGTIPCQAGTADTTPPSAPGSLTATPLTSDRVDLAWTASQDDVGVAAYDVYRDGAFQTSVGASTLAWTDMTVSATTTYVYTVRARDLAGNTSAPSGSATTTTPAPSGAPFFVDGFEAGSLAAWSNQGGVTVQGSELYAGAYAARATATAGAAWAYHSLSPAMTEQYYRIRFKIVSSGASNVYLLKERTSTGGSIMGFYRSSTDSTLNYRNDIAGVTIRSTVPVSLGAWHELQVRLRINGTSGSVETWFDGALVPALSGTANFGTNPVGRVQIGDNTGGRTFDVAFDDVAVGNTFISDAPPGDTVPPTAPGALTAEAISANRVDIAWTPSFDEVGVVTYDIFRNGDLLESVLGNAASYTDTTVDPATTYTYLVYARDLADNVSPASTPATVTTPGSSDTQAPSVPGDVAATVISMSRIDVSWTASGDDVGVTGYTVYRDGSPIGTTDGQTLAFSDTGLAPSSTHNYRVDAFDAAGNRSAQSPAVSGTTLADTTTPSPPTNLAAPTIEIDRVVLTWGASSDDVGVSAYDIYRDGGTSPIASVGGSTLTWTDLAVEPDTSYTYVVLARDAAGNASSPSNQVTATTPATAPPLFVDDFESGTLGAWTNVGMTTQTSPVHGGTYSARAFGTGAPVWAWAPLSSTASDVYARAWMWIPKAPSKTTNLIKLRTASGASIGGLLITSRGRLSYRNDVTAQTVSSTTVMSAGSWHLIDLHLTVNGPAGAIQVSLDGTVVSALSRTDDFGTAPVGRIQIGENQNARPLDFSYDDIEVRRQAF